MIRIACVIVTFNRKVLLKRCLDAVSTQAFKPICVYILDNASTDGTIDAVKEWGFYDTENEGIRYKYILNKQNEGGAGGFYHGMKSAMEDGEYDAIWMMDDDGEPEKECLKNLVKYLGSHDYIAPIVLSDEDRNTCSFVPNTNYSEFCKKVDKRGIVENWASPFNGVLYSTNLIRKIGYPKKEMFIWGDEINYHLRAINSGFIPITVTNAIHFHPVNRVIGICDKRTNNVAIILGDKDWKIYCALRNRIFNLHVVYGYYKSFKKARELYRAYTHYFHAIGDNSHDSLLLDAFISGYFGYFGGLKKYFNK